MTSCFYMPGARNGRESEALDDLATLTRELHRFRIEGGPTEAELESAPLLSAWEVLLAPSSLRLTGIVTSHPRVGPGPGVTAPVVAIDRRHRWMRSSSRLWRLGRPRHGGSISERIS